MTSGLARTLLAALALPLAVGACSSLPVLPPGSSPGASASLAPILDPTPANPTPPGVIANLLQVVRSPTLSFHLEGTAWFTIGTGEIDYKGTVNAAGPDREIDFVETIDGNDVPIHIRYIKGILYNKNNTTGAWEPDAGPDATTYGRIIYNLQHTLVLGDLGADKLNGNTVYRLRVTSGIDLYPPQFQDGTIASPHDAQSRLELTVDPSGIPLEAYETRSVAGTVNGVAGVAKGTFEVIFSQVNSVAQPSAPVIDGGVVLPTPQPTPSPIPANWVTPPAGDRGFAMTFPSTPEDSSQTVQTAAGPLPVELRVATVSSSLAFTEADAVYPSAYVTDHPIADQLRDAQQGEATNAGGQLVGSIPITIAGQPGVEFYVATKAALFRSEAFILGDRRVTLSVVGSLDEVGSSLADEFLGSVALTH